jgi:Tfp pilus assembly protein PilF
MPAAPIRRRTTRIAAVIVTTVAVAAAAWGTWATLAHPRETLGVPAVRVRRFVTDVGDTASAYLAATLQQDVVAALADSRGARVFVTDSVPLKSGYAVSATAARLADSVEVRLTVTTEPDGEFKGQRMIRQSLGRIHELPGQVTDGILSLVGRPSSGARTNRPPTTDSLAYDLFRRGRYQTDRRTEPSTRRAVALFRAAVERDSNFAEGWAGLARALQQTYLRRYRIPGIGPDSVLPLLIAASERAIEADSSRSYVWIARGLSLRDIEPSSRRNAILAYERAISLDSNNADAWHYSAVAWDDSLEPARALAAWRRVLRIDPTHRQALGFLGQHFNWMRQYDSARFWADSGRRIDPTYFLARLELAIAQLYLRDTAGAAENFRAALRIGMGPDEVNGWVGLADIAVQQKDRRAADTLFARALAIADTLHPALHDAAFMAWGYAALGDNDRAVRVLERFDPRADSHFQLHLHCDPGLDPLRSLPRFQALIVRRTKVCI